MENTLQNKAKFFAQYWFQLVQRYGNDYNLKQVNAFIEESLLEGDYLFLNHIKNVSKEHSKEISKMMGVGKVKNPIMFVKDKLELVAANNDYWALPLYLVDYLRSKGYALHFMGLSVEQLVEYGWVKIRD